MAKKKSALTGRFQNALKTHAQDDTNYGVDLTDPPPGITGGIAQLTSASIGEYKSGKYQGEKFCRMAGTIVSPKKHTYSPRTFANGKIQILDPVTVSPEGLFTSIMVPLCDTVKGNGETVDLDEHIATMLNECRKLGADTTEIESEEDLNAMLEALVEEAPYFKFGTSSSDPTKDYPEPRVWQNWYGNKGLENYTQEDVDDEVIDESEDDAPDAPAEEEDADEGLTLEDLAAAADDGNEDAAREVAERAQGSGLDPEEYDTWADVAAAIEGGGKGLKTLDEDEAEEGEEEEEEGQFTSLGMAADDGDEEAIERLTVHAEEAGLDPDDYPVSWGSLAEALNETVAAEDGAEEGSEEYVPEKGDVILYRPKGAKKARECEVLTVNTGNSTSTLKSLDDGKKYPGVAWSDFVE